MDKNFLLAILLSALVIFVFNFLFMPEKPPVEDVQQVESAQEAESTETSSVPVKEVEASQETTTDQPTDAAPRTSVRVNSGLYSVEIDSQNGSLQEFILKEYAYWSNPHFNVTEFVMSLFFSKKKQEAVYDPDRLVNMAGADADMNSIWKFWLGPEELDVNYQVSAESVTVDSYPEQLEMKARLASGLEMQKILTFHPNSYKIDMEVKVVNRTGEQQMINPRVNFGTGGEYIAGETLPQPKRGITFVDEDFEKYDSGDVETPVSFNNSLWAGSMDKYFISVVKSADNNTLNGKLQPFDQVLNGEKTIIPQFIYTDEPIRLDNNQEYSRRFQLYIGPKIESSLEQFDRYLPQAMDLGWFEILARPLLSLLRWLQGYVINWGIAIIILTIIVRTAMFPLAFKGMTSMRRMQALSPKINALREKYKGNKEKLNQEIMKFYSQNKVNPMGGCLPMLLQIPIFIALYQALLPAIELRHTPFFLFWDDLAANDFTLILPILMGVTMFVQQSLTPTPTMDPTQAKIMRWMPVMMVLFFLNMPSGLVLYWVISNVISVGQQLVINKVMPPAQVAIDPKGKGKAASDSGKKKKGTKAKK